MKTEKNDKAVNTRIPTATWEWLTSIGTAGGTVNTIICEAEEAAKAGTPPHKISQGLADLRMIRTRSKNELKGLFTPAEWMYMADSLNGTMVTTDFRCLPMALVAGIEDSDTYDALGAKWEVDVPSLTEKVKKLTAAQVDAVFTRVEAFVEAFWDSEEKDLEEWSKW